MGETKGMEQLLRQYLHEFFHLPIFLTESAVYFVEPPVFLYIHIPVERWIEHEAVRLHLITGYGKGTGFQSFRDVPSTRYA